MLDIYGLNDRDFERWRSNIQVGTRFVCTENTATPARVGVELTVTQNHIRSVVGYVSEGHIEVELDAELIPFDTWGIVWPADYRSLTSLTSKWIAYRHRDGINRIRWEIVEEEETH